jgi:heme/flavin dehydrogenase (mycofactocin system)
VNKWFETVAVAERRAKRFLPKTVYGMLVGGTEAGITTNDNLTAFDELGVLPVTAGQSATRAMETTIMGQPSSMPVMISPTGVQAVHPGAEVAVAAGAAARGIPMGLSSFASKPIEDVVEANGQTFFQIYWAGDKDSMIARLERARAAGAVGIILTLDWSFDTARDWGSPDIPQKMDLKVFARHFHEGVLRPRWALEWTLTGGFPTLGVPNYPVGDDPVPGFFDAYVDWMQTPPPTWDDVAWLREQWDGHFMVKGIYRVDEAQRAVDAGATAISVSNHGGNNLDGAPAPIRVLPAIADAVGSDVEVLLDGGIRRGSDVVKALAFGAKAVLIGRAYLWGLAVNGQAGVENVLDVLRQGIDSHLLGLGKASIDELGPDDILVPPGFFVDA